MKDDKEMIQHVRELVKSIDFCILTTISEDGKPSSRPMSSNGEFTEDNAIWLFTYGNTHKALDVEKTRSVNVSFAEPKNQTYIVATGQGELNRDKKKITELWKPQFKAWFPRGIDEPDIALIKVTVESLELWEGPSTFASRVYHMGKAMVTGHYDGGEHQKISVPN